MTSTRTELRSLAFWGTALVGIIQCGSSEPAPALLADASDDSIHTVGDSAAMSRDVDVALFDATPADVDLPADSSVDSFGGDGTSSTCSQGSDCASGEVCVVFPYGSSCRADPCGGQAPSCACGRFACAPDYTCQSASTGLIQCHRNG